MRFCLEHACRTAASVRRLPTPTVKHLRVCHTVTVSVCHAVTVPPPDAVTVPPSDAVTVPAWVCSWLKLLQCASGMLRTPTSLGILTKTGRQYTQVGSWWQHIRNCHLAYMHLILSSVHVPCADHYGSSKVKNSRNSYRYTCHNLQGLCACRTCKLTCSAVATCHGVQQPIAPSCRVACTHQ